MGRRRMIVLLQLRSRMFGVGLSRLVIRSIHRFQNRIIMSGCFLRRRLVMSRGSIHARRVRSMICLSPMIGFCLGLAVRRLCGRHRMIGGSAMFRRC